MTLDEAIKHAEEVAEEKESEAQNLEYSKLDWRHEANQCSKCAEEHRQLAEWLKDYKRLLEQQPCDDTISRILKRMWNCRGKHTTSIDKVKMEQILRDELLPVKPQEPAYCDRNICLKNEYNGISCDECEVTKSQEPYDFAKWVASEIFDEWEYNKDAFAEIACRKLAKLGIVRAKGDEWELVEQEPSGEEWEDGYKRAWAEAEVVFEKEPQTGHWEWLTEDKYRCSNCNHETRVDECMNKPMYDFCPFCGARMVEPQERNDKG